MKYKNMKIEINESQPLNDVVMELERLGYDQDVFQMDSPSLVVCYPDGFYMALIPSSRTRLPVLKTTLTELKAMTND